MMQLNRYIYTNGVEQDYDYVRLARKTKTLTYDKRFLDPWIDVYQGLKTPFREIRFARPDEVIDPQWKHLLDNQPKTKVGISTYLMQLKEALKRYFRELWNPEVNYLMFHSGGRDSRILSAALAECRDEGLRCDNVHFRCYPVECEAFNEIMKCEGWKPSQYSCYNHDADNFFDIGHKEISVNGWASYIQQMNFWNDLGTDWTVIHGWGGEVFRFYVRYQNYTKIHCNNRLLNSTLQRMIGREWEGQWMTVFNDVLSPYFSYYYLDVAMRARKEWIVLDKEDWHIDTIRNALVKIFKYPIDRIPYPTRDYQWGITDELKKNMKEDYYSSRFYRDYGHLTRKLSLFDKNMYVWDGRTWGFMTVYDKICE